MSPKHDGSITTFFQPKDGEKAQRKAAEPVADSSNDPPIAPSPPHEEKGKGKIQSSNSPSPPAVKKRNTKEPTASTPTHLSSRDLPPTWLQGFSDGAQDANPTTLSLTVHKGDLFSDAPANCLLIHACNTQGSWGAGIARAFRDRYPKAYAIYRDFCTKEYDSKYSPIFTGTALLIPPVDSGEPHWIGCLFTSAKYGRAKAKPEQIVRNTGPAMQMLLALVRLANEDGEGVSRVRMCKINSGLFGVPWEKTTEALEAIQVQDGWPTSVEVWEP